ncbi:MAG: magnetochrome domain-containing protein [Desulfamplus sp.]|nr:magnetochrome domain-containing protein [Desulfamplus sp.]
MKNNIEYEFCMSQFKMAIVGITVLLVIVLGWTGYHCTRNPHMRDFRMAAAAQPSAPPIKAKDKMLHPYWGNCNKCHITVDAGKPVSQVMAGPPIAIKDKMLHEYWGNCVLCHKVTDGFQPQAAKGGQADNNAGQQALAAAFNQITPESLGLTLQPVTAAMMKSMGLANEDGLLVTEVAPGSIADKAGLQKGDEIIRIGKIRQETLADLDRALSALKPGSEVKVSIYRGKKSRNIFINLADAPVDGVLAAAATVPMTQNQIETLAEQLGVPKTEQAVTQALAARKAQQGGQQIQQGGHQAQVVANLNFGKVAVASTGPGIVYQISARFEKSPYFVVFDPAQNSYSVATNPNVNDLFGQGVETAQYMVDLNASSVIAGSFSQDALNAFHVLMVNVYPGLTGSVRDVLSSYMAGSLIPSTIAAPSAMPSNQMMSPYAGGTGGNVQNQALY